MLTMRLFLIISLAVSGVGLFGGEPLVPAKQLREWLFHLSSDDMKGRANGSPEIREAANWLAERYKDAGFKPLPGRNDYFHHATVTPRGSEEKVDIINVLGWLEGSDPKLKHEYIMLSGHYDHVGEDPSLEGDTIFNGADDDGSGVVLTLGVLQTLKEMKKQPGFKGLKRSVLAVAWAAEEMGLKGSKSYAAAPFVPIENMAVNLNFEMVGHTQKKGKNQVWLVGDKFSNLHSLIQDQFPPLGWTLAPDAFPQMNLFFRSDNATFAMMKFNREERTAVGVPAHSFSTWGGEEHYHKVSDEPDIIDYENLEGLTQVMSAVVVKLANLDERVEWVENDFVKFSRPQEKKSE